MQFFYLFIVCFVLFLCCGPGEAQVELKEHPSVVSITNRVSAHVCDGAIITTWHVVTNCYCLAKVIGNWHQVLDPYDFKVAAGMTSTEQIIELHSQLRDIKVLIVHPRCKKLPNGAIFDIGLTVVRRPFKITEYVHPAHIGFFQEAHDSSDVISPVLARLGSCQLLTWFAPNGSKAVLHSQEVKIRDSASCQNEVPDIAAAYQCKDCYFCTTMSKKFGCSKTLAGAPVYCESFFTGVFKSIENCSEHSSYVFSRVDSSMDWIGYIISLGGGKKITPSWNLIISLLILQIHKNFYNMFSCYIIK